MNRSQLMGVDSVGIDIYDIHEYFRELTVGQLTLGFWGITPWYQSLGIQTSKARSLCIHVLCCGIVCCI